MDFQKLKVHFIGIGGIGVSGLARFLKAQGVEVSGSDIMHTPITQTLIDEGITINIPHAKEVIANKDVIIHSAIIKDTNIEIQESKSLNKQILSRKEALSILLSKKKVLSICAAHGKSSTSALLASILSESGAIIGAISKEFQSNVRTSSDELLVFEADESDKSFLNSNPYKSIIINIEAEHLENYNNDFAKLKDAYYDFINLSQHTLLNIDCQIVHELYLKLQDAKKKGQKIPSITTFSPSKDIKEISCTLKNKEPFTNFKLRDLGNFSVYGIGYHNVINASIAILSASDFLQLEKIRTNLLQFKGIKKRFDILQHIEENTPCIIDDYAHHPTEIKATILAAKTYRNLLKEAYQLPDDSLKITAIFQPHKYSRLRDNLESFQECFEGCDELIILPVWAAGEEKIDFDFQTLFNRYNLCFGAKIKRENTKLLVLNADNTVIKTLTKGILLGLGAGDITYQLRGEK